MQMNINLLKTLTTAMLGLAIITTGAAYAQSASGSSQNPGANNQTQPQTQPTTPPPSDKATHAGKHPGGRMGGMAQALNLTDEQKTQLQQIHKDQQDKMKALLK